MNDLKDFVAWTKDPLLFAAGIAFYLQIAVVPALKELKEKVNRLMETFQQEVRRLDTQHDTCHDAMGDRITGVQEDVARIGGLLNGSQSKAKSGGYINPG